MAWLRDSLLVAAGASIGANLRHWTGVAFAARWGTGFPWATLGVNVVGSFLLGLFAFAAGALDWSPQVRLVLAVGLLGGFTTFSAFSAETVGLIQSGRLLAAAGYVLGSVVPSLLAWWAGGKLGSLAVRQP